MKISITHYLRESIKPCMPSKIFRGLWQATKIASIKTRGQGLACKKVNTSLFLSPESLYPAQHAPRLSMRPEAQEAYSIPKAGNLYCIDPANASGWHFGMRCSILPSKASTLTKKKLFKKVLRSGIVFITSLKNYRLRIEKWWKTTRLIQIAPALMTTPSHNFPRPLAH